MLKKLILKPKQIPQIPGLKAAEAPIAWDNATWKNEAYLRGRAPIPINSNYWVLFKNNKNTGNLLLLKKPPPKGVFSDSQFSRSTQLINNLFNFKQLVNENLLTPDTSPNGEPLCMKQYHELFNSCRIPNNGLDLLHSNPKIYGDQNDYIIVMAKDQMYKLKLTTSNGERVSLKELKRIMLQVGNDCLSTTPQPAIGLLTAGNRDTWAAAYKKLSTLSPQNAQNLETIKNSLFVVCLDDYSTISNPDIANLQMLHNFDGSNRWFDKPIQLLVANNGRAGVNAEHTPVDAMVAGRAFNYILENEPAIDPIQTEKSEFLDPPEKLIWTIDESIEKSIQESKSVIKALADDTVSIILSSTIYGSRFIKEIANASPDSYVQLVFQIVWNRLHGPTPPTAIYESAMTRQYEDGRTENIRSLSKDSWDFATAFDNDNVLYDDKRELFRKAIATHRNTIKEAVSGNGIDRYLLFLSLDPTQTFQQTPEYKSMMNFQLATSNATFPNLLIYGGFGPLVRDNAQPGYGINYSIDRDGINLSLSGKKTGKTDVYEFRRVFEQVLKDMMILFPKRSQIWGMGWEKKHEDEKKETAYFNSMKRASDEYLIKKQKLYEKLEKEKENASR